MLIGDLVHKTGFSKDTIRFYEKQGLIKISRRERRANNYKEYPESVMDDLKIIRRLKNLGFTLVEIGNFLALAKHNLASCDRISGALTAKVQFIDEKIAELTALRNMISSAFADTNDCCTVQQKGQNCEVFDPNVVLPETFRSILS
ncbi:MAG: MerR family DNA-binding protein [Saprospiraceae bacterium]|nr:MerR family DNA-binding protein [Saprospiraceae bacterium]